LTKKLLRTREYIKALDQLIAPGEDDQEAPVSLQLTPVQARDLTALRDLWHSLDGKSVKYGLRQKGVDIRTGLDITTLTLKQQVDTIILVSGDSALCPLPNSSVARALNSSSIPSGSRSMQICLNT